MNRNKLCILTSVLFITLWGCADEPEEVVVPLECSVCEAGTSYCLGEFSVTCDADGTGMTALSCLQGQTCDPAQGICVLSYCPEYGFRGCADDSTASQCVEGALVDVPCAAEEVCRGGACVSATLEGSACGYKAVLTGTGEDIAVSECGIGQTCTVEEGEAKCTAQVCEPGTRTCQDEDEDGVNELAQVCNGDGTGADSAGQEDCSEALGTCIDGFCSCAEPVSTGSEGDLEDVVDDLNLDGGPSVDISIELSDSLVKGDVPELQAPNKASGWIGGSKISFKSYANVFFEEANTRLVISFADGQKKVEMAIGDATENWSGTASEATAGFVGYNDGSGVGQDFKWGAGVSALGNNYGGTLEIVIEENGGPGGRVIGTFTGDLQVGQGEDGAPLGITDGTFDIYYD